MVHISNNRLNISVKLTKTAGTMVYVHENHKYSSTRLGKSLIDE